MFPNPTIFGISLEWYSLWQWIAITITIIFAIGYFIKNMRKMSINKKTFILMTFVCFGLGYMGARLLSVIDQFTDTGQWMSWQEIITNPGQGQLRWYGAILFMLIGAPIVVKLLRLKAFPKMLDFLALNLCLFTAIVKQACFFSGDGCYGIYTALPWGMYFPYGPAPNILPVHPTPLYDTLFHLMFFIFLLIWNKRKTFAGQTAIIFFIGTSIFNIAIEFIRINPKIALNLTLSQFSYLLICMVMLLYSFYFRKNNSIA